MKNKTLKKHEKEYIHINKRIIWSFPLFLLMLGLTMGSICVLIESWNFLGILSAINCVSNCNDVTSLHQLLIVPMLILEYVILSLLVLSFINLFRKLKSYDEVGLIYELILGLIVGLIAGLIAGLLYGLIAGFLYGLLVGLIYGLIYGLIGEWEI